MSLLQKLLQGKLRSKSSQDALAPRALNCFRFFASGRLDTGISNTQADNQLMRSCPGTQLTEASKKGDDRLRDVRETLGQLADQFADFYVFENVGNEGLKMRDVLSAKDGSMGKDWDYVRHDEDGYDRYSRRWIEVKPGDPILSISLPDVLPPKEWKFIENMLGYVERNEYHKLSTARVRRLRFIHLPEEWWP